MFLKFQNQDDTSSNSYLRVITNDKEFNLYDSNCEEIKFNQGSNGVMDVKLEIWTKNNLGRRGRIAFMKCLNSDNNEDDGNNIIPIKLIDTPIDIECKKINNNNNNNNDNNNNNSPSKSNELIDMANQSNLNNRNNNDQFIIILKNKSSLNISNNELEHCIYAYFNINDSRLVSSESKLISDQYQLQIYIKNNGEKYIINSENTELLVLPNIRQQINDSITCSISILHLKSKKQVLNTDLVFKIDSKLINSFPKKYYISNNNSNNNNYNYQDILIISEKDKQKNLFQFTLNSNQLITLSEPIN